MNLIERCRKFSLGIVFMILCSCSIFHPGIFADSSSTIENAEQTPTAFISPIPTLTTPIADPIPSQTISEPTQTVVLPGDRPQIQSPQIGLNFIRFFWSARRRGPLDQTEPYFQPDWIFADFEDLGVQAYRQFVRGDLLWDVVEPANDRWDFRAADAVLFSGGSFEPIVTLFALQYASPTPPWEKDPAAFQKSIGPDAEDYLKTVVQRYAKVVRYWELGNEMDHWRAADEPMGNPNKAKSPPFSPPGGFSPQEQGAFLAEAASIIRQYDPDAVIVMPGMGGLDEYNLKGWLPGVIEGGGSNWFDVINYHHYNSWERYGRLRLGLRSSVERLGISEKPIWLTETGVTANPENTVRTDYPNTPEAQAADVFRRIVQAFGYGDALVMWHTYISSPISEDNSWGLYGIRTDKAECLPSYYAMKLLISELIPFERAEILSNDPRGLNSFRIIGQDGETRYVVWGRGSIEVPEGMTEYTVVVPGAEGEYTWHAVVEGESLPVSEIPILLHQ